MALEDDFQDKTEEPTDEKQRDFREKGQVAQSREFTSVFALLGAFLFFNFYGMQFLDEMKALMVDIFTKKLVSTMSWPELHNLLGLISNRVIRALSPLFLAIIALVLLSGLSQTRFNVSFKRLAPNFKKMNPISGIGRFFSSQMVVDLAKSIAKIVAVATITYIILSGEIYTLPTLSHFAISDLWTYWGQVIERLFMSVLAFMLVISGLDYMYNWFQMNKKMKMTKQEVKDEMKNREGDPLVKRRIRDVQRQMSNNRMIKAMADATVLITNPTHFAVALRYEKGMAAPIVVAKGQDFLALRLREIAKEKEIPIVENKPLARTLYKMLKIGQQIPASLYKSISEIIAYIYRLRRATS